MLFLLRGQNSSVVDHSHGRNLMMKMKEPSLLVYSQGTLAFWKMLVSVLPRQRGRLFTSSVPFAKCSGCRSSSIASAVDPYFCQIFSFRNVHAKARILDLSCPLDLFVIERCQAKGSSGIQNSATQHKRVELLDDVRWRWSKM